MNDRYTIGEIFRQGLLKNHLGEPYKDKATVSKVLAGVPFKVKKTPWGEAKTYSQEQLEKLNNRW